MIEPKVIDGTVYEHESLEVSREYLHLTVAGEPPESLPCEPWSSAPRLGTELLPTKRTRWLSFLNDRGKLVYAPGVRTFQLALMLGMGREWYDAAMKEPEPAPLERAMLLGAENIRRSTQGLVGAP